jgi:hypothetical protein
MRSAAGTKVPSSTLLIVACEQLTLHGRYINKHENQQWPLRSNQSSNRKIRYAVCFVRSVPD